MRGVVYMRKTPFLPIPNVRGRKLGRDVIPFLQNPVLRSWLGFEDTLYCYKKLPINGQQVPINGHQLPINGQQLPINGQQLPINGHQLPINGHQLATNGQQPPNYGLPLNYDPQAAFAQYTDNFGSFNIPSVIENGNFSPNLHNPWSMYSMTANNQARPGLVDEWVHMAANSCNYQGQGIVQFPNNNVSYQYPRNGAISLPADYSVQNTGHVRVQEEIDSGVHGDPLENPNSNAIVVVSSDGMSGSNSPTDMPLHPSPNGCGVIRPQPARSPYEWIRRTSYQQTQPNPGRTRTKDKYRIVYTDHQRLELEKEFHYSRYITIRRKIELASLLSLSERQIKIWFQNRRAKERRQAKKRAELALKNKNAQVMFQNQQHLVNAGIY
ncbi:homeobox protein CDX-1 [Nephila pilipes]|uniref:Homeobox protein CDX-1 n=1 Tax=Nephila pilipes TaxID=299642 RepID=A0A8X6MXD3_NEPPI|nr:homeobox protein CDX-1 [Nephila pilipes]